MSIDWANTGPYERVVFRGRGMNARDAAMILEAERRFGSQVPITQGPFSTSVTASAGTHSGGGAVDWALAGMSAKRKAKFGRACKNVGWAWWLRPYLAGVWPEHAHGVAKGCRNAAPLAKEQMGDFDRGLDGLASGFADPSYRPDPPVEFDYGVWVDARIRRTRIRKLTGRIGEWTRTIRGLRLKVAAAVKTRREHREWLAKHA